MTRAQKVRLYNTKFNIYADLKRMFLLEKNVYYERLLAVKNQRSLENKETVGFILENGEETGSRYFSDLSKGNTMYLAGTIEYGILPTTFS